MAPPPAPSGWYRDPGDPLALRHWNGRTWDCRGRTLPAWTVGTREFELLRTGRAGDPSLEGPVRKAGLPAIATATAAASRPARGGATAGRAVATGGAAGAGTGPTGVIGGARPARRRSAWRPPLAFMTTSALVSLIVVVLVATVGLASRPSTVPTLAQDPAFLRSANIACGEAMGAVRQTGSALGPAGAPLPAEVAAANQVLSRLTAEIRALPVVGSAQAEIQGWLGAWARYASDRQRQADAARGASGSSSATSLASQVSLDEAQADAFVTTHGLAACALAPTTPLTTS